MNGFPLGADPYPSLAGIQIVTNPHLTIQKAAPRTWGERLLSWPWRPWAKTKQVTEPDRNVYMMDNNLGGRPTAVCHAAVYEEIRKALCTEEGLH